MPNRVVHMLHPLPVQIVDIVIGVLKPDGITAALILIITLHLQTGEDLQFTFASGPLDASGVGPHRCQSNRC